MVKTFLVVCSLFIASQASAVSYRNGDIKYINGIPHKLEARWVPQYGPSILTPPPPVIYQTPPQPIPQYVPQVLPQPVPQQQVIPQFIPQHKSIFNRPSQCGPNGCPF